MKKNRNKLLIVLAIVLTLGITFWYGGNAPGLRGWSSADTESNAEDVEKSAEADDYDEIERKETNNDVQEKLDEANAEIQEKLDEANTENQEKLKEAEEKEMEIDPETGKDQYATDPVPEGKPIPVEPGSKPKPVTNANKSATLSVRCDTLLDNLDVLEPNKVSSVPKNGIIYAAKKVDFSDGDSVFDLFLSEMKKSKIHMEFTNTPAYNSAYIEGINNLYEFDGGELSGWMYKVNGWFPNYGASRYALEDGDIVEWVYTLDLGKDVGGSNSTGGN